MSNKNTVVRAIRIDSSLDKALAENATEKGLSFNLLVNKVLTKYAEFDKVSEKLGFVGFPPSSLKHFLNLVSIEEAEKMGTLSGFSGENAKQFTNMLVGRYNMQGFLETLGLIGKYTKAFSSEIISRDDGCLIIMSHALGEKWSHFLKGMLLSTLRDVYGV
ncbi:MAG: hypothetical protein ACRDF4_09245, partial [Rhabdochlamydiaceae bacterium]